MGKKTEKSCIDCLHYRIYKGPDPRGKMICNRKGMKGYTDDEGVDHIYYEFSVCSSGYTPGIKGLDWILFG